MTAALRLPKDRLAKARLCQGSARCGPMRFLRRTTSLRIYRPPSPKPFRAEWFRPSEIFCRRRFYAEYGQIPGHAGSVAAGEGSASRWTKRARSPPVIAGSIAIILTPAPYVKIYCRYGICCDIFPHIPSIPAMKMPSLSRLANNMNKLRGGSMLRLRYAVIFIRPLSRMVD